MKTPRSFPQAVISKKASLRVQNGHPWIYAEDIICCEEGIENGALVDAVTEGGKYLGTGLTIDITAINMLSPDHADKVYSFESDDYIFSIYCDDKKTVSPVCISEDELINIIRQ